MVRLVVTASDAGHESANQFQFQYGAIGGDSVQYFSEAEFISIPVWCDWWEVGANHFALFNLFQFQYGAIGGELLLKAAKSTLKFQFQYGAIGGKLMIHSPYYIDEKFQFQYGAIGGSQSGEYFHPDNISIPVWCDWWFAPKFFCCQVAKFQFQYGAIGGGS